MIALASGYGMSGVQLARFIEQKCMDKAARGDPIRSAGFFTRCIPADFPEFRDSHVKSSSATRYWQDPYEERSGGPHAQN